MNEEDMLHRVAQLVDLDTRLKMEEAFGYRFQPQNTPIMKI